MALREIIAKFGVEVDAEKLDHLHEQIGGMTEKLKAFGEVLVAGFLGEKLKEFIEEQIHLGDELDDTAERLGITTDELQRFQIAGQLSGASAEEAATGLRFLNKNLGDAIIGGGDAADTFKKLHVAIKNADGTQRPFEETLGDIAEGFGGLKTHAEKTAYAMKIFGRGGAALVPMLAEGRAGVEELLNATEDLGGGMSKEFAKQANDAEHATVKLKFAFRGLKSRIAAELIPGFQRMTERTTKWVVAAIKLAKQTNVLKAAIIALKLGGVALILAKIVKILGLGESGALGFVKGFLKLGLIAVAALALFLIFEDLYTLFTGGESLIGKVIDSLFGIGASKAVVEELKGAWEALAAFWSGGGSDAAKTLANVIVQELVASVKLLKEAGEQVAEVFKFVFALFHGNLGDAAKSVDAMKKNISDVGKVLGDAAHNAMTGETGMLKEMYGPQAASIAGPSPSLPAAFSEKKTGTSDNSITVTNNITTTADPKEVAKAAGAATKKSALDAQNRNAFAGVRAGG